MTTCEMTVIDDDRTQTTFVLLDGAFDRDALPPLRAALVLLAEAATRTGGLVLDLSSVSVLDGHGARLLAALARGRSFHIRLRGPAHHLRAVVAAAATRPFLAS